MTSSTGQAKRSRAQQAGQAAPAGKPDDHFAVAVHARKRADHRDEQAQAQNGGQLAEHGEAHDQHHVGGADAAARGLPRVRISIMVITTVTSTTSVAPKLRASSLRMDESNNIGSKENTDYEL
jgi:hypothetical protein